MGLFSRFKKDETTTSEEPAGDDKQEKREHKPVKLLSTTRTIVIANQKGGVGKTTTAVSLGSWLALDGYKTLIVDIDPQGNATSGLGVNPHTIEKCIYDVLMNRENIKDIITETIVDNLYVAPASIRLVGAQVELVSMMSRETRLKSILGLLKGAYHFIIIDCPPSLGLLTLNGLTSADELIIPVQCEYYALEGLSQLLESIDQVKKYLNPELELAGLVMTMHDSRTKIGQQVIEEVRSHFPDKVYSAIIPRSVRLSEAPSFGQPITHYDALSRGAIAYKDLAKEVVAHG